MDTDSYAYGYPNGYLDEHVQPKCYAESLRDRKFLYKSNWLGDTVSDAECLRNVDPERNT